MSKTEKNLNEPPDTCPVCGAKPKAFNRVV
jgi:rubrerythrin